MKTSIKDIDSTKKEIKVSVPFQEFEKFVKRATESLTKGVELKGFRKGQAPQEMAAQAVGQGEILQEAANLAVKEFYPQIIQKHKLEVLGAPQIEVLKLAPNNPFEFKATVFILPEIKLPDYKDKVKQVKKQDITVSDKEVDEAFEQVQKDKDKIPEEQRRNIDFDKPGQLKETLRQEIFRQKTLAEKQRIRNEILEVIVKDCQFEIPEILIKMERYRVMEDLKRNVSQVLKMTFEDYLKKIKKTEKELEDSLVSDITLKIKRILILKEIQKQEKITVGEEEIKKETDIFLANPPDQKAKENIDQNELKSYFKERMEQEKTLQFLESLTR